jgi:hypothetical protein
VVTLITDSQRLTADDPLVYVASHLPSHCSSRTGGSAVGTVLEMTTVGGVVAGGVVMGGEVTGTVSGVVGGVVGATNSVVVVTGSGTVVDGAVVVGVVVVVVIVGAVEVDIEGGFVVVVGVGLVVGGREDGVGADGSASVDGVGVDVGRVVADGREVVVGVSASTKSTGVPLSPLGAGVYGATVVIETVGLADVSCCAATSLTNGRPGLLTGVRGGRVTVETWPDSVWSCS